MSAALEYKFVKRLHSVNGDMTLDVAGEVAQNEFMAVYGPSGSGKTTFLRMLAGLTEPDSGYLRLGDRVLYDSSRKINIPVRFRRVGFLFQDYALFPNMTVYENVRFALGKNSPLTKIDEILSVMELSALKDKFPERLSGGQKQRIALARTLVERPDILLLDEPLSAVDWDMRSRLQDDLERIHKGYSIPTILVSHDPAEIVRLAEYALRLENGSFSDKKNPKDLFKKVTI
ncbi:MAG: ATP-binding cassette domain-containing protein [Fibrobacteres bacterium]|nr:ATP-binding cassette domain-containing protein [Fibrobacterota bacterium]